MATRLLFSGRVQGVGFRYSLCAQARRLGLSGWVRNRADGSVEAHIEGPPAAREALTAWARRGPPGARVDGLVESVTPDAGSPGFEQHPTA